MRIALVQYASSLESDSVLGVVPFAADDGHIACSVRRIIILFG